MRLAPCRHCDSPDHLAADCDQSDTRAAASLRDTRWAVLRLHIDAMLAATQDALPQMLTEAGRQCLIVQAETLQSVARYMDEAEHRG
jgi:hypothetical protein